jgi:hypothetical protein
MLVHLHECCRRWFLSHDTAAIAAPWSCGSLGRLETPIVSLAAGRHQRDCCCLAALSMLDTSQA